MKFKYRETPKMKSPTLSFLVLTCILLFSYPQWSVGQDIKTVQDVKDKLEKADQGLECWVCNSMLGPCPGDRTFCNKEIDVEDPMTMSTIKAYDYFRRVYGTAFTDKATAKVESEWPESLASLAMRDMSGDARVAGWTFGNYPGAYPVNSPAPPVEGVRVLPVNWKDFKGFKSCLKMRIWTGEQKNGGAKTQITEEKPRVISTCSPAYHKDKNLNLNSAGCKTINTKASTVEVCYCKGTTTKDGETVPCNRSSYLRISQYWIMAAFLLIFVVNFGMNIQL